MPCLSRGNWGKSPTLCTMPLFRVDHVYPSGKIQWYNKNTLSRLPDSLFRYDGLTLSKHMNHDCCWNRSFEGWRDFIQRIRKGNGKFSYKNTQRLCPVIVFPHLLHRSIQDCLLQWLQHSGKDSCELCKYKFRFTPVYAENAPKRVAAHQVFWRWVLGSYWLVWEYKISFE